MNPNRLRVDQPEVNRCLPGLAETASSQRHVGRASEIEEVFRCKLHRSDLAPDRSEALQD